MLPAPDAAARTGRASPLPPDERRTAILAAVQELILERGTAVTTRDLAAAAGVAEGTLFRVFEDKTTLVREAVTSAIDPSHMVDAMRSIDPDEPLDERVTQVLQVGRQRVERTVAWMSLLHQLGRPEHGGDHHGQPAAWQEKRRTVAAAVRAELVRLLAPDADRLRIGTEEAAELLETVLVGSAVRTVENARSGERRAAIDPRALARFFLSGVLDPDLPPPADLVPEGSTSC